MIGDAEPRRLDHAEIVGAVAGHQRVDLVEVEGFAQLDQRCELGGAAEDRLGDFAGQLAVANHQLVGAVFLEADLGGDRIGEQREAARDQAGVGAVGAHGHDQFAAARRRRDAFCQHLVDHADRQVLQQRDALAQRRLEFDFAAHRAFGDRGDMRLQPGEIGQFVDAFLADHGGIHVRQKKLLAPDRDRLHDNVDRQVAARRLQAGFDRLDVVRALDLMSKGMSTATSSNSHCAVPGEGRTASAPSTMVRVERGIGRIADEGGDEGHAGEFARFEQGRAYRRADRQRQVGAGARTWRKRPAASSSTPIPCRSIAISASSRRGRRWRRRRACRTGSMAMSTRR